jgi:hypothetical protein
MIPDPASTMFILSVLGVSTFIFVILSRALLGLRKHKVTDSTRSMDSAVAKCPEIENMSVLDPERERDLDRSFIEEISKVIVVLPDLEA